MNPPTDDERQAIRQRVEQACAILGSVGRRKELPHSGIRHPSRPDAFLTDDQLDAHYRLTGIKRPYSTLSQADNASRLKPPRAANDPGTAP